MDKYINFIKKKVEKAINQQISFFNEFDKEQNKNKILMKILLISKEDLNSNSQYYVKVGDNFVSKKKPIFFSIYLAFLSSFDDKKYLEGIDYLSSIAAFFQDSKSFLNTDYPEMIEDNIEDFFISLEPFSNTKFTKLPQCPFLIYKVGLIPVLKDDNIQKIVPSIKTI